MSESSGGDDGTREELVEKLKALSEDERKELLEKVETDDRVPILHWSSNPKAVKSAFNFVQSKGTLTFEELRAYLHDEGHISAEEGSYNFGVVDTENNVFFRTNGPREAATEISLTELGEEYAEVFDTSPDLRPIERSLLIGMQPYGSGFRFLAILEANREDGILREDLENELVDIYEGSGSYFTGYYSSWFNKLGLVEKEQDGRKKRYKPDFPSAW